MSARSKRIAFVVAVSVVLLEITFRLVPEFRFHRNIVFDPVLGHRGPRDSFVEIGDQKLYYNAWGFRDRLVDPDASGGETKLVVLGDSITEAVEVSEKDSWATWTENVMNSALSRMVSVYKFAASDWGTYQELLALDRHHDDLKPEVVVVQFLGINDFANNSIAFAGRTGSENDGWRPYFNKYRPWLPSYVNWVRQFLRTVSHTYRAMDSVYVSNYEYGRRGLRRQEKCDPLLGLFQENPPDDWVQAFSVTNGIAKQFGRRKEKYKKIVAVYFPSHIEMVDEYWRNEVLNRQKSCAPELAVNRHQPELVFENAFRSAGIEVFSLWDAFRKERDPKALFDDTGHLTRRGHQVAGEQIAYYFYNKHPQLFGGKK